MTIINCGRCSKLFGGIPAFQKHDCKPDHTRHERRLEIDYGKNQIVDRLSSPPKGWVTSRGGHEISDASFSCCRCGAPAEALNGSIACISDAEVALSLKLQSLFDQQQKRAVALFNGGML